MTVAMTENEIDLIVLAVLILDNFAATKDTRQQIAVLDQSARIIDNVFCRSRFTTTPAYKNCCASLTENWSNENADFREFYRTLCLIVFESDSVGNNYSG